MHAFDDTFCEVEDCGKPIVTGHTPGDVVCTTCSKALQKCTACGKTVKPDDACTEV